MNQTPPHSEALTTWLNNTWVGMFFSLDLATDDCISVQCTAREQP
jgi:hypothetical protein